MMSRALATLVRAKMMDEKATQKNLRLIWDIFADSIACANRPKSRATDGLNHFKGLGPERFAATRTDCGKRILRLPIALIVLSSVLYCRSTCSSVGTTLDLCNHAQRVDVESYGAPLEVCRLYQGCAATHHGVENDIPRFGIIPNAVTHELGRTASCVRMQAMSRCAGVLSAKI